MVDPACRRIEGGLLKLGAAIVMHDHALAATTSSLGLIGS